MEILSVLGRNDKQRVMDESLQMLLLPRHPPSFKRSMEPLGLPLLRAGPMGQERVDSGVLVLMNGEMEYVRCYLLFVVIYIMKPVRFDIECDE